MTKMLAVPPQKGVFFRHGHEAMDKPPWGFTLLCRTSYAKRKAPLVSTKREVECLLGGSSKHGAQARAQREERRRRSVQRRQASAALLARQRISHTL
ncbi:hypothetical protein SARC_11324 [Sphaeroforma arctica JP610]|uniref:Uncharacterized protein n=1 Tax=Sphaeroforma arctica JP610 TaxID=667725 RepID=A0A0L0FJG7_9EUKA|nr:hypothetical protein SARC_11324 [Sphaeroforma arctica JP610]KNC76163.1 hypothetical protein SARC_11324 [Sphaeroforma arctica JP610]|eukprot:XP_014150065.1 hypothetical protein SARC_11324 [Sphaeroforma arctica JP610]